MTETARQPQPGDIRRFVVEDAQRTPRVTLARTAVLGFDRILVPADGGSLTCDAEANVESAYLILDGQARLTDGRNVMAELGPLEGVHVPRGASCRLEPASAIDLDVLCMTAIDPRPDSGRRFARQALPRAIRYDSPDLGDALIKVPYLIEQSDMLGVSVEKVRDGGGDDGFHTHSGTDSVWYVLGGGRARFRCPDGSEIVVGANEGVSIPRMAAYGFIGLDHEPSEVLHVKVRDLSVPNERIDYGPKVRGPG